MAARRDPDDIEALLAEVERAVSGTGGRVPAPSGASAPERGRRSKGSAAASPSRAAAVPRAVVPAVVLAAVVGLLFLVLPFLGPVSGAAGAFLGALLAGLWARWGH